MNTTWRALRGKATYANVVATMALFIALSTGGAWAAKMIKGSEIKPKTITAKQIKGKTITSKEIKPKTITAKEIKPGSLTSSLLVGGLSAGPAGPQGPSGVTGAQGPTGPIGAAGLKGATGGAGLFGRGGTTGAKGATGVAGPTGPTGSTGATGPGTIDGAAVMSGRVTNPANQLCSLVGAPSGLSATGTCDAEGVASVQGLAPQGRVRNLR